MHVFKNKTAYFLIILFLVSCKKNSIEREILSAYKDEDFLTVAKLCSGYVSDKVEKECSVGLGKSEEEIQKIISQKQDLPFFKLMINSEKQRKIEELLKKNIYLGVKYRSIWRETSENF
ncbi:MAG: hypothetical protein SFU98_07535 [Leptospiraceae bacterium]|nr:hypothetical protein [Leptospiraceae bacterium]